MKRSGSYPSARIKGSGRVRGLAVRGQGHADCEADETQEHRT